MYKGKVKNILERGFGFISCDKLKQEFFCPPQLITQNNLTQGDNVEFDYKPSRRDPNKNEVFTIKKVESPHFKFALTIDKLSVEEYDEFCDMTKDYVNQSDFERNITTSKIRNIFSAVQNAKTIKDIKMLRPKLAYLSGRDSKTKNFMNDLEKLILKIKTEKELKSFKQFFEAIVCYKKAIEK